MKVEKLSTSRVNQYLSCPQQYYFERHSDKQAVDFGGDNAPLHKGSIIHQVLEKLRYKPKKELVSDFVHEVNKEYEEYLLSPTEVKEIVNLLKNWIDTRDLGYEILDVEKYFKIPVKGFYLTGKIDVIERLNENQLRVTDYKTGGAHKSKEDLKESMQLKFYTLAAMETYGVDNVEVAYDQIRFEPPEYIQYRRNDLVDFLQYVVSIRERIKDDEVHKPNPGYHCAWCDYYHHCPVMDIDLEEDDEGEVQGLEIKGFSYKELAQKYNEIHGQIKVLENKKDNLKEMIMGKMEKEGRDEYDGDDVTIKKRQNQYTKYDPKTVIENVPEDKINEVLKVKKKNVDELDIEEEKRKKIQDSASRTYSSEYVRISG